MRKFRWKITRLLLPTTALVIIGFAQTILASQAGIDPSMFDQSITIDQIKRNSNGSNSWELVANSHKKSRIHPIRTVSKSSNIVLLENRSIQIADAIKTFIAGGATNSANVTPSRKSENLKTIMGEDGASIQARVVFNKRNNTPRMIKILAKNSILRANQSAQAPLSVEAANKFLSSNQDLLSIDNAEEEFVVSKKWTDDLGIHHVRYLQHYQEIPVWGKEAIVHMDGANEVYMFQGAIEPTPQNIEKAYVIGEQDAIEASFDHLGISNSNADMVKKAEPVWYPLASGKLVSAYCIEVMPSLDQCWLYFIDAQSGQVLHRISRVTHEVISTSGTDLDGGPQSFSAWNDPQTNTQQSINPTIPWDNPPYDVNIKEPNGNTYFLDLKNQSGDNISATLFTGPDWDPAVVSMAAHIQLINDYYTNTFNRNGLDNQNMNTILACHYGRNHNNAAWTGSLIYFGDGDNKVFSNLAGSLDVTAHEYTHGVVDFTANLIYENQSGALNEAYADIFACMVDRDDWTVGEQITVQTPRYMRSLADPSSGMEVLPSKMSEYQNKAIDDDHGGVHTNCTIPSHAAYLLAEGLDAQGLGTSIGREKTEQIFYRALTNYLTQSSEFADAREATIQAAQDLYGEQDASAVQAAWDAVEVTSNGSNNDPTPVDPVSGEDAMIYLRPADNSGENFNLYAQRIASPFDGYDAAMDTGPLNTAPAAYQRPSVLTQNGQTIIFYVGTDTHLYAAKLDGENAQIGDESGIHNFAISSDGSYLALTQEDDGPYIGVADLKNDTQVVYELTSPSTSPDGNVTQSTIMYTDSIYFDYTGKVLIFDAYNSIAIGDDADEYSYWSIGLMNVTTGQLSWPIANQSPNLDIGNPVFANNHNYVIVLDIIDHSTNPATSTVRTIDFSTQTVNVVADANPTHHDFGDTIVSGCPSFWGDDDAITMQISMPDENSLAYKVPLNNWSGVADEAVLLNDNILVKPLMHRIGERQMNAELTLSTASLKFNKTTLSDELVIKNSSNRDIDITGIAISGPGEASFRHDGVNGLLPKNEKKSIQIYFEPPSHASGTQAATLTVQSDADTPAIEISLSGTTGDGSNNSSDDDNSSSGCFIDTLP